MQAFDSHILLQLLLPQHFIDPLHLESIDLIRIESKVYRVSVFGDTIQLLGDPIVVDTKLRSLEQETERRSFGNVNFFGAECLGEQRGRGTCSAGEHGHGDHFSLCHHELVVPTGRNVANSRFDGA